ECNNLKTGAQIEVLIMPAYATPKISASGSSTSISSDPARSTSRPDERGASQGELVVAVPLRRIDMGRDGARGGTDHRAGIAVRPRGRRERRIHAPVTAGRNRHGRGAAADQFHGLDVVAALLLACCDRDVFPHLVGWATLGGAEPVRGFGVENVTLLAYVDPGLEVRDLEMVVTLFDHSPECHMRRVAVAGHVERCHPERIGLQLERP